MQPSPGPVVRVHRRLPRRRIRQGIRALAAVSLGAVSVAIARPVFAQDASGAVTGKITTADDLAVKAQKINVNGDVEITIEAGTRLTLKCGPSQIQLSSAGVSVSGPMINLG